MANIRIVNEAINNGNNGYESTVNAIQFSSLGISQKTETDDDGNDGRILLSAPPLESRITEKGQCPAPETEINNSDYRADISCSNPNDCEHCHHNNPVDSNYSTSSETEDNKYERNVNNEYQWLPSLSSPSGLGKKLVNNQNCKSSGSSKKLSQTKWYLPLFNSNWNVNSKLLSLSSQVNKNFSGKGKETDKNGAGVTAVNSCQPYVVKRERPISPGQNRHSWYFSSDNKDNVHSSVMPTDDITQHDRFTPNLSNQMRAVSSPSLSENLGEEQQQSQQQQQDGKESSTDKNRSNSQSQSLKKATHTNSNTLPYRHRYQYPNHQSGITGQNYAGVLQKFKKTFSQFKGAGGNSTGNNCTSNSGPGKLNNDCNRNGGGDTLTNISTSQQINITDTEATRYRFGPLIWRSSKERRKVKYNRRDKCNSGDSGIQIELENEDILLNDAHEVIEASSSPKAINSRIRRANSAKVCGGNNNSMTSNALSAKAKVLRKMENSYNTTINGGKTTIISIPTRSLSQPSGLDRMARIADLDESDTDSVSSHLDLHEGGQRHSTYAEVLYPFTPVGPQELSLDKGMIVEILRKDIGPWWYGRIIKEQRNRNKSRYSTANTTIAVEKKQYRQEQTYGWFPKEFVRIISCCYTENSGNENNSNAVACGNDDANAIGDDIDDDDDIDTDKINDQDIEDEDTIYDIDDDVHNNATIINVLEDNDNGESSKYKSCDTTLKEKTNNCLRTETIPLTTNVTSMKSPSHKKIQSVNLQQKSQQFNNNTENLRNNAIKELLETEINYVKLLSSLCLGYLKGMRKRIDIFPTESLNLIFSNIESIWKFQQQFLNALRIGIENSQIAQVFLENQSGFVVYSQYCNSYPLALMELESYSSSKEAKCILENCRIAENLPELPLSAHLLAPIQRICRYPLHLNELIKHTPSRIQLLQQQQHSSTDENDSSHHEDTSTTVGQGMKGEDCKENFEIALAAMKKVTETVNEGKRHSESLNRFQTSFENFQGPPIACHSTRFFMQTDATRVSPNLWNNTYTLFLFDHQLIYCKKDILKRNHFIYKGRIFLDNCRILNLPDGKLFGMTLKNALRIYCESRNKWFDFCFRSASRKIRFLSTLAVERQFCGKSLFVSELVGDCDDEAYSDDREYHSDYDTPSGGNERLENVVLSNTERRGSRSMWKGGKAPRKYVKSANGKAGMINRNMSAENFHSMSYGTMYWRENMYEVSDKDHCLNFESPAKMQKYNSGTLPKKSRKTSSAKENYNSSGNTVEDGASGGGSQPSSYEYGTGSLGRRRIGNWFRKSRSTNSTPNQSPTHHHAPTVIAPGGGVAVFNSDSSSQSSPALGGYKTGNKLKINEPIS